MPTDVSQFQQAIAAKRQETVSRLLRLVDQFGEVVNGDAQELCPVDTGFLKASATTRPAILNKNVISKVIGFNAVYAIFVHENLKAKHPQGQAKFLETAIRMKAPEFDGFIAGGMQ